MNQKYNSYGDLKVRKNLFVRADQKFTKLDINLFLGYT